MPVVTGCYSLVVSPNSQFVYVLDGKSKFSVISTSTHTVEAVVDIGFKIDERTPISISANGRIIYITTEDEFAVLLTPKASNIRLFDAQAPYTEARKISLPNSTPPTFRSAVSADGKYFYASITEHDLVGNLTTGKIVVYSINLDNLILVKSITDPLLKAMTGIAVSPDGRTLYAGNVKSNIVCIIDITTGSVAALFIGGGDVIEQTSLALSPNGAWLYIGNLKRMDGPPLALSENRECVVDVIDTLNKKWTSTVSPSTQTVINPLNVATRPVPIVLL